MHHQPNPCDPNPRGVTAEAPIGTRHLTVVRGAIRHDVAADPTLSVDEVLMDVLGDVPSTMLGGVQPGAPWQAISLTGEVVVGGSSIARAGLVDGSVIVAAAPTLLGLNPAVEPTGVGGNGGIGGARGGRRQRRDQLEVRAASGSMAFRVAGCCALGLGVCAPLVVGLQRTDVPFLRIGLLALAFAAALSRVVPDLILRLPPLAPPAPTASPATPATVRGTGESSSASASVRRWVRLVSRRQVGAHLAVLVVVLLASGILLRALAATAGPSASGPALVSVVVSAVVLAGSARGRSRPDRWTLRVAAATAALPVLPVAAARLSTPAAVGAAATCVVVALAALAPVWRRRPLRARPSRLASGGDVLVVVAVLPLACWAAGLLSGVQAWAYGVP